MSVEIPQIPNTNAVKTQGTTRNLPFRVPTNPGFKPELDRETIWSAMVAQYVMKMTKAATAISKPMARSSFLKAVC